MAETWMAVAPDVSFSTSKSMIDVFNATGSGRVVRIRRCYHFNNMQVSHAGQLAVFQLLRSTAASGGTAITPTARDNANTALHANITAGTGRTVTDSSIFRQYVWSMDEPSIAAQTMDEWETQVPFAEIWNAGYGDTAIQAVTCRADQGFHIKQITTATPAATVTNDYEIEFDNDAS